MNPVVWYLKQPLYHCALLNLLLLIFILFSINDLLIFSFQCCKVITSSPVCPNSFVYVCLFSTFKRLFYTNICLSLSKHVKHQRQSFRNNKKENNIICLMGQSRLLFRLFIGPFKRTIQFWQQINAKNVMSIKFTGPGFKLTTSRTWIVSHNHKPRAPEYSFRLQPRASVNLISH